MELEYHDIIKLNSFVFLSVRVIGTRVPITLLKFCWKSYWDKLLRHEPITSLQSKTLLIPTQFRSRNLSEKGANRDFEFWCPNNLGVKIAEYHNHVSRLLKDLLASATHWGKSASHFSINTQILRKVNICLPLITFDITCLLTNYMFDYKSAVCLHINCLLTYIAAVCLKNVNCLST